MRILLYAYRQTFVSSDGTSNIAYIMSNLCYVHQKMNGLDTIYCTLRLCIYEGLRSISINIGPYTHNDTHLLDQNINMSNTIYRSLHYAFAVSV